MRKIQVLIAVRTLLPFVADIVRVALAGQPDITLRTTDAAADALESGDLLTTVDTVVVGDLVPDARALPRRLVYAHPRTAVLAISADGRDAELLALRPNLTRLEAVAPPDLVAAIRIAATDAMIWKV